MRGATGSANQQAFVSAAFAANEYGISSLYHLSNDQQMLNQLMKIKYLEGPFATPNKQNLIKTLFTQIKIGQEPSEHAFSPNT
jgi:hypothetical protein